VTTTDGTGVVHTAVMYGEDDYALGKKIGLPEHHTVDEEGKFTKDVPGLTGDYVKAKENRIAHFQHLESRGKPPSRRTLQARISSLLALRHAPFWYYARTSWFIGMSKLRG